ncbi:molybdopterin molybdotransferase MoeA [Pseudonocardia ailaonensis]|uniref:Molybdopterin molybdenumtransferase n=1 Tax=Pseudonocardia ailaonensis TaxID=367279 RepID=A0ABN2NFV9_9PSEU
MRTVEEHRTVVAALLGPTAIVELPLAEARGKVLAEAVRAGVDLPPFDNSAMDGYAVRAADIEGAPVTLPVTADIPAGRTDVPVLEPGTAHRIMTGAPMPAGADAVVQVELTDGGTETVTVSEARAAGTHIRPRGEDVVAGAVVLEAGTVLGAAQIGVAAAVGRGTLPVFRPPHVLVLSTGSELVGPDRPLQPGQIYESNGAMLAAAVRDAGATAEQLSFVPDDVEQFRAVLAEKVDAGVDLVMTSGGVSAGAYEVVKDAFTGHGVDFVRVGMQPGGPQGAGVVRLGEVDCPVVTLPGNPVSSLVSFEVFVRPALLRAMGHPYPDRPVVTARTREALRSPEGKRQFRRGVLDARDGTVGEIGTPASHMLGALARADCLIVVPEERTEVAAGEELDVWLLEAF